MKYFVISLILLFGISVYASCAINNLYEIKPEQNVTSTQKKKHTNKGVNKGVNIGVKGANQSKECIQPEENTESLPFFTFHKKNNNGASVYIWKHEP